MSRIALPRNFTAVIPIVAGVGNALMALPMVRQLKSRGGAGRVVILARIDAMAEPFRRVPEVDEVLVTGGGAKGIFRTIAASRRAKPDLLLVPFPSNRWQYSMLAATSGARHALLHDYPIGYFRAMHFIGTRAAATRGIHDVEQNLRLLSALGIEPDFSDSPRFNLNQSDRDAAADLLRASDLPGHGFIALHAGSAQTVLAAAKRWPSVHYAQLIAGLRDETGLPIALLEGPDEVGVGDEINAARSPGESPAAIIKLRGNLGAAAALLEAATLYVGSDSGLAHLAAAVGTKAVTLFGPADPDRVCPHGNRDLVVQPSVSCNPCFLYPWESTYPKIRCGENGRAMCITQISIEQVMATVHRAMATVPAAREKSAGRA